MGLLLVINVEEFRPTYHKDEDGAPEWQTGLHHLYNPKLIVFGLPIN